jgi:TolA-binding protein
MTFLALLALTAAGCFYPAERGKMLEERLDRLEADNRELESALQAQKERLEAQIPKLDAQVALVKQTLDALDKSARRTGADIGIQVEQLQADLATLRGKLEESVFKLTEVQTALAELKEPGTKPATAGAAQGGEPAPVEKKPEPIEKPTDKKAFADLVVKRLQEAPAEGRSLAGEWLRKYPTDALAARIHYELGASYFAEKNCRGALAEFGTLIKPDAPKSFAKSEWAPEALLKSSECFDALKMREEARLALEEIVNTYPKSPAAKTAKAKLTSYKTPKKGKGR